MLRPPRFLTNPCHSIPFGAQSFDVNTVTVEQLTYKVPFELYCARDDYVHGVYHDADGALFPWWSDAPDAIMPLWHHAIMSSCHNAIMPQCHHSHYHIVMHGRSSTFVPAAQLQTTPLHSCIYHDFTHRHCGSHPHRFPYH